MTEYLSVLEGAIAVDRFQGRENVDMCGFVVAKERR
jgi:hypothetical protein